MKVRDLKKALLHLPDELEIVMRDEDEAYITFFNSFTLKGDVAILIKDAYYHTYEQLKGHIK